MRSTNPKTTKTFRLDSELLRQLEVMAETENRTLNNMVETILMRAVATNAYPPIIIQNESPSLEP